jgi:hypothetical protein
MGMLLRYTYEVRDSAEYLDEFQDVRMTKDMLDLAKHIVEQKSGRFDPYSRTTTLAKISDWKFSQAYQFRRASRPSQMGFTPEHAPRCCSLWNREWHAGWMPTDLDGKAGLDAPLYEIHTLPQPPLIHPVLSGDAVGELARLRNFLWKATVLISASCRERLTSSLEGRGSDQVRRVQTQSLLCSVPLLTTNFSWCLKYFH